MQSEIQNLKKLIYALSVRSKSTTVTETDIKWIHLMEQVYPTETLIEMLTAKAITTALKTWISNPIFLTTQCQIYGLGAIPIFNPDQKLLLNQDFSSLNGTLLLRSNYFSDTYSINNGSAMVTFKIDDTASWSFSLTPAKLQQPETSVTGHNTGINSQHLQDYGIKALVPSLSIQSKVRAGATQTTARISLNSTVGKRLFAKYLQYSERRTVPKPIPTATYAGATYATFKNWIVKLTNKKTYSFASRCLTMFMNIENGNIVIRPVVFSLSTLKASIKLAICEPYIFQYSVDLVNCFMQLFNSVYIPVPFKNLNLNDPKMQLMCASSQIKEVVSTISDVVINMMSSDSNSKLVNYTALSALFQVQNLSMYVPTAQQFTLSMAPGSVVFSIPSNTQIKGTLSEGKILTPNFQFGTEIYSFSVLRAGKDNLGSEDVFNGATCPMFGIYPLKGSYGYNPSDIFTISGISPIQTSVPMFINYNNNQKTTSAVFTLKSEIVSCAFNRVVLLGAKGTIYDLNPSIIITSQKADYPAGTYDGNYYINGFYSTTFDNNDTYTFGIYGTAQMTTTLEVVIPFNEIMALSTDNNTLTISLNVNGSAQNYTMDLEKKENYVNGQFSTTLYGVVPVQSYSCNIFSGESFTPRTGKAYCPCYEWINTSSNEIIPVKICDTDGIKVYNLHRNMYMSFTDYSNDSQAYVPFKYNNANMVLSDLSTWNSEIPPASDKLHYPSGLYLSNAEYCLEGPSFTPDNTHINLNFLGQPGFGNVSITKPATTPTSAVRYTYGNVNFASFISSISFPSQPYIFYAFSGNFILLNQIGFTATLTSGAGSGAAVFAPDGFDPSYDASDAIKNVMNEVTMLVQSNTLIKNSINNINARITGLETAVKNLTIRVNELVTMIQAQQNAQNTPWYEQVIDLAGELASTVFPAFAPLIMSGVILVNGAINLTRGDVDEGMSDFLLGIIGILVNAKEITPDGFSKMAGNYEGIGETEADLKANIEHVRGKTINANSYGYKTLDEALEQCGSADLFDNLDPNGKLLFGFSELDWHDDSGIISETCIVARCNEEYSMAKLTYNTEVSDTALVDDVTSLKSYTNSVTGDSRTYSTASTVDLVNTDLGTMTLEQITDITEWFKMLNLSRNTMNPNSYMVFDVDTSLMDNYPLMFPYEGNDEVGRVVCNLINSKLLHSSSKNQYLNCKSANCKINLTRSLYKETAISLDIFRKSNFNVTRSANMMNISELYLRLLCDAPSIVFSKWC